MARILVTGAANVDLIGAPADRLIPGVSNPGTIALAPGGAARNVAEHLSQMGHDVHLITAVGDDPFGRWVLDATAQAGVDVSSAFQFPGQRTGLYLAILDDGEVTAAVSATGIVEELTPESLQTRAPLFSQADIVVADANLLPEALWEVHRLSRNALLCLLPVSPQKATRLREILAEADLVVGSAKEGEVLAGRPCGSRADLILLGRAILSHGPKVVALTMGGEGAVVITEDAYLWAPAPNVKVVDPTGAGDAFAAGIIHGRALRLPLREMLEGAMDRAAIALKARGNLWRHLLGDSS
ncbi:MAG: carbohydrate kinase family protein [Armatimonadota bacterium]|nr:carbohydrate kinase family protein [Armatimonadota bacterium]MDR5702453.1 carbohydrate kinase family protein [Armatimonadota bacterium]